MLGFSDARRRFTCCFCLHVRTGTIILGVGQIIVHLVCIAVLILSALRPDMFPLENSGVAHNGLDTRSRALSVIFHFVPGISELQESGSSTTPKTELGNHDYVSADSAHHQDNGFFETQNNMHFEEEAMKSTEDFMDHKKSRRPYSPYFALCLSTFSLAFCCFLVYGAVARQPTHLLPFFFLQVFDFIISLLTIIGYMSATSDARLWLRTKLHHSRYHQDGTMLVDPTSFAFLLLSIYCVILAFKAYCLGMVWDCYKYLMLTHHRGDQTSEWNNEGLRFMPSVWGLLGTGCRFGPQRSNFRRHTDSSGDIETSRPTAVPYDQSNDLPNYDDALKTPANAFAPPPYFQSKPINKPSPEVGENTPATVPTESHQQAPKNNNTSPQL